MTHSVNVVENIDVLEVYPSEDFDQGRIDPNEMISDLRNRFAHEMKLLIEKGLEWEADQQIGAVKYQRGVMEREDYRNGYRKRELSTSMGAVVLKVPRGRNKRLSFSILQAYQRRWPDLDALLLEAHIGGLSCRDAGERIGRILGRKWSGSTIAKLKSRLIEQLKEFKHQELKDEYVALLLDGMYIRIRQCGKRKRPLIAVIGIKADGSRELLAMKVCYSENSTEVEGLLRNIKERGVKGVNLELVTIDGDKGLEAAVLAVYGNVRIQDCRFHKINRIHKHATGKKRARAMMKDASDAFALRNPREQRKALAVFCNRWREKEPDAIDKFEYRLDRCFELNRLPSELRSLVSTSNACEGLFKQIRQRIKSIGAFENPMAVELYVYAVVCRKKWIAIPGRPAAAPLIPFTHFS